MNQSGFSGSILAILLFALLVPGCNGAGSGNPGVSDIFSENSNVVKTGAERLIESYLDELEGLRVGLVMNPTARIGQAHMLDTLLSRGVSISALYAPEHGFRGEAGAGEVIRDGRDQATGLPVFSLYGDTRKPTQEMLENVDLLLFDMQDVGARFYTYISTLGLVLEAAAEAGLPVWVLDRPNPAGGEYVSGWSMEEEFRSFVGMYPIPVAHGMTLGELARMMIGEEWIMFDTPPELRVIEMEGWSREMVWPETGLDWVPPSPNLPTFEHAFVYLGTCFVEGTSLSEGRGTDDPFLLLGAPDTSFEPDELRDLQQNIPGARLSSAVFEPRSIPGVAAAPKYEGERVHGLRVELTDVSLYDPVVSGLKILKFLMDHTEDAEFNSFVYRLSGSEQITALRDGEEVWNGFDAAPFREARQAYLLY
ncbi:MAG: DUF1343 domain-containing protein [Balneolaceae bacterium]